MVELRLIGNDGQVPRVQMLQPNRSQPTQVPDTSAQSLQNAQQINAQANQTAQQAIALTGEAYANSALAAARRGANRLQTFNEVVQSVGTGVELWNELHRKQLEGMQTSEASLLRQEAYDAIQGVRAQFGMDIQTMGVTEAYNKYSRSLRDFQVRARNRQLPGDILDEVDKIIHTDISSALDSRNRTLLSDMETIREQSLASYEAELEITTLSQVQSLSSRYTSPEAVRSTLDSIESNITTFIRDRGLSPQEGLNLRTTILRSARDYLEERNISIREITERANQVQEVSNLVNAAYADYENPDSAAYRQEGMLAGRISEIAAQYPGIPVTDIAETRSPQFGIRAAVEQRTLLERLRELGNAQGSTSSLINRLSGDAYDYIYNTIAVGVAFPGSVEIADGVSFNQLRAEAERTGNIDLVNALEAGQRLQTDFQRFTELTNGLNSLRARARTLNTELEQLADRVDPNARLGELTLPNAILELLVQIPAAAGVQERGTASRTTFSAFRDEIAVVLETEQQNLEESIRDLVNRYPDYIILGDLEATMEQLEIERQRVQPAIDAALEAPDPYLQPDNPQSYVPPANLPGQPSFLRGMG